jgi:hypothetical protein
LAADRPTPLRGEFDLLRYCPKRSRQSGGSDRERAYRSPGVQPRIPDQAGNPEFRRKGVAGSTELSAGTEEPQYLYTLTPTGEQRRKFLLAQTENDAGGVAVPQGHLRVLIVA